MSKVKSKEETFVIELRDLNFDEACAAAYRQALRIWDIGDSGDSKLEAEFPRSESSLEIEFISLQMTGTMVGGRNAYIFKTWLQKDL